MPVNSRCSGEKAIAASTTRVKRTSNSDLQQSAQRTKSTRRRARSIVGDDGEIETFRANGTKDIETETNLNMSTQQVAETGEEAEEDEVEENETLQSECVSEMLDESCTSEFGLNANKTATEGILNLSAELDPVELRSVTDTVDEVDLIDKASPKPNKVADVEFDNAPIPSETESVKPTDISHSTCEERDQSCATRRLLDGQDAAGNQSSNNVAPKVLDGLSIVACENILDSTGESLQSDEAGPQVLPVVQDGLSIDSDKTINSSADSVETVSMSQASVENETTEAEIGRATGASRNPAETGELCSFVVPTASVGLAPSVACGDDTNSTGTALLDTTSGDGGGRSTVGHLRCVVDSPKQPSIPGCVAQTDEILTVDSGSNLSHSAEDSDSADLIVRDETFEHSDVNKTSVQLSAEENQDFCASLETVTDLSHHALPKELDQTVGYTSSSLPPDSSNNDIQPFLAGAADWSNSGFAGEVEKKRKSESVEAPAGEEMNIDGSNDFTNANENRDTIKSTDSAVDESVQEATDEQKDLGGSDVNESGENLRVTRRQMEQWVRGCPPAELEQDSDVEVSFKTTPLQQSRPVVDPSSGVRRMHICECGKDFSRRSGLVLHQKGAKCPRKKKDMEMLDDSADCISFAMGPVETSSPRVIHERSKTNPMFPPCDGLNEEFSAKHSSDSCPEQNVQSVSQGEQPCPRELNPTGEGCSTVSEPAGQATTAAQYNAEHEADQPSRKQSQSDGEKRDETAAVQGLKKSTEANEPGPSVRSSKKKAFPRTYGVRLSRRTKGKRTKSDTKEVNPQPARQATTRRHSRSVGHPGGNESSVGSSRGSRSLSVDNGGKSMNAEASEQQPSIGDLLQALDHVDSSDAREDSATEGETAADESHRRQTVASDKKALKENVAIVSRAGRKASGNDSSRTRRDANKRRVKGLNAVRKQKFGSVKMQNTRRNVMRQKQNSKSAPHQNQLRAVYKCPCGETKSTKKLLRRHQENSDCDIVDFAEMPKLYVRRPTDLVVRRKRQHKSERKFRCSCGMVYRHAASLYNHRKQKGCKKPSDDVQVIEESEDVNESGWLSADEEVSFNPKSVSRVTEETFSSALEKATAQKNVPTVVEPPSHEAKQATDCETAVQTATPETRKSAPKTGSRRLSSKVEMALKIHNEGLEIGKRRNRIGKVEYICKCDSVFKGHGSLQRHMKNSEDCTGYWEKMDGRSKGFGSLEGLEDTLTTTSADNTMDSVDRAGDTQLAEASKEETSRVPERPGTVEAGSSGNTNFAGRKPCKKNTAVFAEVKVPKATKGRKKGFVVKKQTVTVRKRVQRLPGQGGFFFPCSCGRKYTHKRDLSTHQKKSEKCPKNSRFVKAREFPADPKYLAKHGGVGAEGWHVEDEEEMDLPDAAAKLHTDEDAAEQSEDSGEPSAVRPPESKAKSRVETSTARRKSREVIDVEDTLGTSPSKKTQGTSAKRRRSESSSAKKAEPGGKTKTTSDRNLETHDVCSCGRPNCRQILCSCGTNCHKIGALKRHLKETRCGNAKTEAEKEAIIKNALQQWEGYGNTAEPATGNNASDTTEGKQSHTTDLKTRTTPFKRTDLSTRGSAKTVAGKSKQTQLTESAKKRLTDLYPIKARQSEIDEMVKKIGRKMEPLRTAGVHPTEKEIRIGTKAPKRRKVCPVTEEPEEMSRSNILEKSSGTKIVLGRKLQVKKTKIPSTHAQKDIMHATANKSAEIIDRRTKKNRAAKAQLLVSNAKRRRNSKQSDRHFPCSCGKVFQHISSLQRHQRQTPWCDKTFEDGFIGLKRRRKGKGNLVSARAQRDSASRRDKTDLNPTASAPADTSANRDEDFTLEQRNSSSRGKIMLRRLRMDNAVFPKSPEAIEMRSEQWRRSSELKVATDHIDSQRSVETSPNKVKVRPNAEGECQQIALLTTSEENAPESTSGKETLESTAEKAPEEEAPESTAEEMAQKSVSEEDPPESTELPEDTATKDDATPCSPGGLLSGTDRVTLVSPPRVTRLTLSLLDFHAPADFTPAEHSRITDASGSLPTEVKTSVESTRRGGSVHLISPPRPTRTTLSSLENMEALAAEVRENSTTTTDGLLKFSLPESNDMMNNSMTSQMEREDSVEGVEGQHEIQGDAEQNKGSEQVEGCVEESKRANEAKSEAHDETPARGRRSRAREAGETNRHQETSQTSANSETGETGATEGAGLVESVTTASGEAQHKDFPTTTADTDGDAPEAPKQVASAETSTTAEAEEIDTAEETKKEDRLFQNETRDPEKSSDEKPPTRENEEPAAGETRDQSADSLSRRESRISPAAAARRRRAIQRQQGPYR